MMTPRDTQFAGFAKLLSTEIDEAWNSETLDPERDGLDVTEEKQRLLIARRAYDLVQHTIGYSLEYLDDCGRQIPGSMNARIQPTIPDMTTLPEVSE